MPKRYRFLTLLNLKQEGFMSNLVIQQSNFQITSNFTPNLAHSCSSFNNSQYDFIGENALFSFDKISALALEHLEEVGVVNQSALESLRNGFSSFFNYVTNSRFERLTKGTENHSIPLDCYSPTDCNDIDNSTLHSRAVNASRTISESSEVTGGFFAKLFGLDKPPLEWVDSQEFLRLRADDLREKVLFLSGDHDHNGALKPSYISDLLSFFALNYDMKYAVIETMEDLCSQVESAAKTGKLSHVIIGAHGNSQGIILSQEDQTQFWLNKSSDLSCLNNVDLHGRITLLSCQTGKPDPSGNIAQQIANVAECLTVAPKIKVLGRFTTINNKQTNHFYHPICVIPSSKIFPLAVNVGIALYDHICSKFPGVRNSFLPFRPQFKSCQNQGKSQLLHAKEKVASEVIEKGLISKDLIAPSSISHGLTTGHCSEDPRKKFVVLVANHSKSGWVYSDPLDPTKLAEPMTHLADHHDFSYNVVSSKADICAKVLQAAKTGPLAGVLIQGLADRSHPALSLSETDEINATNTHELACLKSLDHNGSITLLSDSIAEPSYYAPNQQTIPELLAKFTGKRVIAPICSVSGSSIEASSIEPLKLEHPTYSYFARLFNGCSESEGSIMKEYTA